MRDGCFRGASGGFASFVRDGPFLKQRNGQSACGKGMCTENAGEPAADDRRVAGEIAVRRGMRGVSAEIPDFVHSIKILPVSGGMISYR